MPWSHSTYLPPPRDTKSHGHVGKFIENHQPLCLAIFVSVPIVCRATVTPQKNQKNIIHHYFRWEFRQIHYHELYFLMIKKSIDFQYKKNYFRRNLLFLMMFFFSSFCRGLLDPNLPLGFRAISAFNALAIFSKNRDSMGIWCLSDPALPA